MTSTRSEVWQRVRDVFDRALALPVDDRDTFVTQACIGDKSVRQEVAALLAAHERADDFLEAGCVAPIADWPDENLEGLQFGPYRLETRIGGGGMGEVYCARDTRLERTVAIKVILSHIAADEPGRERFEREARVVAGLNHPHICTLYDIGTYARQPGRGSIPYLVMEFLDGETLADRLVFAGAVITLLVAAVAWVVVSKPPPAPPPSERAAPVQLAVLPLRMIGEVTESDRHLGVGIADSIITRLAGVRQIGLRPTAAVLRYADASADTAGAAKALSVGHVLVGTIQRNADTYRITLQLVQSSDGTVAWARSYDVLRRALPNLQDTISQQVVDALRLELTAAERDRVRRRYTGNAEAYNFYLRGRAAFVNYTETGMKQAFEDFEHALALDRDYALARAGLAIAAAWFSVRYAYEHEALEWGARAEREAKAALAADPSLAEATLATASAAGTLYGAFKWPVVIAESTRALTMDPTLELAHVVRMRAYFHLGLFERMADETRAAHELNPLGNVEIARLEMMGSLHSGSHERAREQAATLLARSDAPVIRNYLGLAQFYSGDVAAARATLAEVKRAGRPDVRSQAALAGVEAAAGDRAGARARAIAIERGPYMDHHVAYSLGAAWAQLGDVQASVKWLQQAADTGFPCYPWLTRDTLLDPIRRAPEFAALLDRLRRRYEQDATRYGTGS